MNNLPVLIAILVIPTAVGLVAWAWCAMREVEAELKSFTGFDGLHFDT